MDLENIQINNNDETSPLFVNKQKPKITLINGFHIKHILGFSLINLMMVFTMWVLCFQILNLNKCRDDIWVCICLSLVMFNTFMFSTINIKNIKILNQNQNQII